MGRKAKEFDCGKCGKKYCDEDRKLAGSRGPAKFDAWEIEGVGVLRTCPLPMITDDSREWLALHVHYVHRLLPRAGGIYDQPAAFKQAMEVIERHG